MNKLIATFATLLMLAGASSLVGCNTMQGAGKDVQASGKAIQKCADPNDSTCKPN
jgi:predicted small secreted protein